MHAVHLYHCIDDAPAALVAHARACLDAEERARADRMAHAADRVRFVLAHALVRVALSRHAAVAPAAWTFGTGPHGAPHLTGPVEAMRTLRFSLSHTRGLVAVAVAANRAVGVDAEWLGRTPAPQLARRVCTPDEQQALASLPEASRAEAFLARWTVKEAYVKARGLGLVQPLHHIAVTPDSRGRHGRPEVRFETALDDTVARWQFHQWWLGTAHVLALAVEGTGAWPSVVVEPLDVSGLAG